jgi:class 3 adenylate cyclase/tetratricopeptide (TPR) repeat protein
VPTPTCPSCGKDLPGEFPFCPFCGATLTEQASSAQQEERKIVSVLFCDLVGFTASSEAADPEDVRSRIRPYHTLLRSEIERYGGTVEKFIGDAVMAVFGAPIAHEDDAERAVRAGLRILEAISELNAEDLSLSLQVRIGINTGEAVVSLGARPEEGEGIVTGDVVNTAARLQGAAPIDGIACSEATYRAVERIFEWEELAPVEVKGKAEPLAIHRPLAARARFGSDVIRTHSTPLVGRELERSLLVGSFERSASQRSCQLVTLVGEPGVGKSRLCAELFAHVEGRQGLVRWRQGRCLPYGEGIALWALGEIVKAECGIQETDSPSQAASKLESALPRDDPDLPWLRQRLLALLGQGSEPASQEESFTAWRRVLEAWAEERETVLVFEDLHWADDGLLSFLEHLADWVEGVPLLLLCTARPELYEKRPHFGADARNAQRINLSPLSDEETARLVSSLLERALLPAETQQALLDRAGGNPLYAEEFVRLLQDRNELPGETALPDSVQALIAARLDTLSPERKSLLQDASVLGKVFWAGALADMGGRDPAEVEHALHELSRKELVRASRSSSMEGDHEFGFWHVLVRDVCYGQIPRAARVERHRAAAEWIERQAGGRAEDLADVIAHHYLSACELARAAGQQADASALEASAIRYLALAGERALPLDVTSAEQSLARALDLASPGHPERPGLLERWAQAAQQQGRLADARDALEEALSLHRDRNAPVDAGRVLTDLSRVLWNLGNPRSEHAIAEALALLEAEPPGPELVSAYAGLAARHYVQSAFTEAITAAEQALALAADLGGPEPARALGVLGGARAALGDREGLARMRRALTHAIAQDDGRTAAVLHANLGITIALYEGPQAALVACEEGIAFCERRGITEMAQAIACNRAGFLAANGAPEQALDELASLVVELEAAGDVFFFAVRSEQLLLLAQRGALDDAPSPDEFLARVRASREPLFIAQALAVTARLLRDRGQAERARDLLAELEQTPGIRADPGYASLLPELVRNALASGDHEVAVRLVAGVEPRTPSVAHALASSRALLAEAAGESDAAALHAEAAGRWRGFGNHPELAYALLGQGRCLAALGDPAAEAPLREARELFASMGYAPALAETEALLGDSEAAAV